MSLNQYAFRYFSDDGGEVTSTAYGAENAAVSLTLDTNVRLRVGITHDGSAAPATSKYMLFAAKVGTEAWFEVAYGGLAPVQLFDAGGSPNNVTPGGMNTSARLSAPSVSPTPSFVAGRAWADESGQDDVAISNGQRTELEFCLRLVSARGAQDGDQYKFRVLRIPGAEGSPTDGGGGGGDPFWANVTYLIVNENAANATTTFTDQSASPVATTRQGNAAWTSATQFNGQNVASLDGDADYLNTATNAAFGLGSGDWAIDCFLRVTNLASVRLVWLLFHTSDGNDMDLAISTAGALELWIMDDGFSSSAGVILVNTTYHVAVAKVSGTIRIFVDGVQVASNADAHDLGATRAMTYGATNGGSGEFQGQLGALRVTKNGRGWSSNFTPPTMPLPNS